MKRLIVSLVALGVLAVAHPADAKKHKTEMAPAATKSVQVKGYRTKSGKLVKPHTRVVKVKPGKKGASPAPATK